VPAVGSTCGERHPRQYGGANGRAQHRGAAPAVSGIPAILAGQMAVRSTGAQY